MPVSPTTHEPVAGPETARLCHLRSMPVARIRPLRMGSSVKLNRDLGQRAPPGALPPLGLTAAVPTVPARPAALIMLVPAQLAPGVARLP
jgi:hypothetical protein